MRFALLLFREARIREILQPQRVSGCLALSVGMFEFIEKVQYEIGYCL